MDEEEADTFWTGGRKALEELWKKRDAAPGSSRAGWFLDWDDVEIRVTAADEARTVRRMKKCAQALRNAHRYHRFGSRRYSYWIGVWERNGGWEYETLKEIGLL